MVCCPLLLPSRAERCLPGCPGSPPTTEQVLGLVVGQGANSNKTLLCPVWRPEFETTGLRAALPLEVLQEGSLPLST